MNETRNPTEERKVMTAEEYQQLFKKLSTVPQTSGHVRSTLTSDFVREYFQILTSPQIVELDCLFLSGQLTLQQVDQYASASNDLGKALVKIEQLAQKMAEHFAKKLPTLLTNDANGPSKNGIRNLFKTVQDLRELLPVELRENLSCYASLSIGFRKAFSSFLGSKVIELILTTKDAKLKKLASDFIDLAERISQGLDNEEFRGVQLFNEIRNYRAALSQPGNMGALEKTIDYKPLSPEEKEVQELEMESDLDDVRKEAFYKKILLHEVRSEYPQIVLLGDDVTPNGRYSGFCAFRINFLQNEKIGLPKIVRDHFGNVITNFEIIDGIVNMTINPINGELCLITNKSMNLSQILDPDRYRTLKAYLIKELKKYLQNKEPDIDDLFLPSAKANVQHVQTQVQEEVEEVQTQEQQPEEPINPTWTYEPFKPAVEAKGTEQSVEPETQPADPFKALPKHKRKEVVERIWGAKGAQIMAALRRLLVEKNHQTGSGGGSSHTFFYSERTNQTLPVPDGDTMAPQLLMSMLKNWGVSLVEFAQELGLKSV